jgi:HEAT repeat protein
MISSITRIQGTRSAAIAPVCSAVLAFVWAIGCWGLSSSVMAQTDQPSPGAEEIARWIDELGDNSYTVRQSAADRLLAAGMAARTALVAVSNGPDPETRAAARRLIALVDRSDFDRRLRAFAADTDGRLGITLPGWEAFVTLVGDDGRARALFVDMQQAESRLLAQVFSQPVEARDSSWEYRLTRLLHGRVVVDRRQGPPLGSCATMLFLGALPEPVPSDQAARSVTQLAEAPSVREAVQSDEHRDAVRRLVAAWINNCPNRNDLVLLQRLRLALTYDLAETLPLAVAVAKDPQYLTVPPTTRVMAILAVGKLGGPADVDHLEPLLEDATVFMPARAGQAVGQPANQVQIRDAALVVMLHLTDQAPQQYGFPAVQPHIPTLFNPATLYMPSDAERDAAIEKWRAWRAEHAGGAQQTPTLR